MVCFYLRDSRGTLAHFNLTRVPTQDWKSIEFQNWFSRPLKSIEFGQNVQYIRYWKSMEILNGKEIRSIWAEFNWRQSNSLFMQHWAMCKIEFHDWQYRNMKRSNGIELFKFSVEKVWKMIFKHVWEPCLTVVSANMEIAFARNK